MKKYLTPYLKIMRLKNYVKNVIIFFPIIFSGEITNIELTKFIDLLIVVISFSLFTSVIYIINDYFDQNDDSLHPIKKERPLASQKLSNKNVGYLGLLILIAEAVFYINFEVLQQFRLLFFIYFLNNIFYNILFKKISPIIASLSVSFGFYLRLLIGSVFSNFNISFTLFSLVFLACFLTSYFKKINDISIGNHDLSKNTNQLIFLFISMIITVIYMAHFYSFNLLEFKILVVFNLLLFIFCIYRVYIFFIIYAGPNDPIDLVGLNIDSLTFLLWFITYFEIRFELFAV